MNKRNFCFIVSLLLFQIISAQKENDSLFFNLKFGEQSLQLNKTYISKNQDTLQLTTVKFYISDLQILYADNTVLKEKNSYHLLDVENQVSLKIAIGKKNEKVISKIKFQIGIDSTASVSGALAGDLDPSKGMYWAWQSGYINMKIEGKSASCKTRKNEFQFHIGGYLKPNYAMREVILDANNHIVTVDVSKLFSNIKLIETNSVMIPCKTAMELADYSIKMFKTE